MTAAPFENLPARVPAPDTDVSFEERGLANRNSGLPLELLRHDITPAGAHYLLTHFDMPHLPGDSFRLRIGGAVGTPLDLSLADLLERPQVDMPVTLECAGNGRAGHDPRHRSMPWLYEAVGTALWTGTPLAPLLAEAGAAAPDIDNILLRKLDALPGPSGFKTTMRADPQQTERRPQSLCHLTGRYTGGDVLLHEVKGELCLRSFALLRRMGCIIHPAIVGKPVLSPAAKCVRGKLGAAVFVNGLGLASTIVATAVRSQNLGIQNAQTGEQCLKPIGCVAPKIRWCAVIEVGKWGNVKHHAAGFENAQHVLSSQPVAGC